MLSKELSFIFFDNFDSCMLNRFSNEYLKDGLYFIFIIVEVGITLENLSCLVVTFGVGDEDSVRSLVDEVVRLDHLLINHVVVII